MRPQMQMIPDFEQQPAWRDVLVFSGDTAVDIMLRDFLVNQGFTTSIARDFSVVLKVAAMEWPAVILLDCDSASSADVTFMEELRRTRSLSKIIVMIAAQPELMLVQSPGEWVLLSPFTPEELIATINAAIAARPGNFQ